MDRNWEEFWCCNGQFLAIPLTKVTGTTNLYTNIYAMRNVRDIIQHLPYYLYPLLHLSKTKPLQNAMGSTLDTPYARILDTHGMPSRCGTFPRCRERI